MKNWSLKKLKCLVLCLLLSVAICFPQVYAQEAEFHENTKIYCELLHELEFQSKSVSYNRNMIKVEFENDFFDCVFLVDKNGIIFSSALITNSVENLEMKCALYWTCYSIIVLNNDRLTKENIRKIIETVTVFLYNTVKDKKTSEWIRIRNIKMKSIVLNEKCGIIVEKR